MNNLSPSEPSQIGRYRLIGRLGRGGMGTVYLGQDDAGQRVAIKVINPEYSRYEQFRSRFRREAEAARRVRRFCTAAVLDADLDGEQLYVVTEYVEGPNLDEAVRAHGPLRGSSLDALAVGVATALTAIHGAGVVHRDLKPSNVLLSPVGPRVIDFGIARALDTLGGITGTGELIGTPRYMAPEVLRGEPASPACDVFSWGCLVAFAATGRTPFGGESLPSIMYQVLNTEPSLEGMEPPLRALVAATLRKDPAHRPTAQQILDQMVGPGAAPHPMATAASTVPSPPPVVPPGPTGWAHRRKRLIGVGVIALVVAGLGLRALLSPSGPPADLSYLYRDDFNDSGTGWDGGHYTGDATGKYGYSSQGFYGVDVDDDAAERLQKAPIPFVPTPPATPDPSASPTPVTPERLLLTVTATMRESSGSGEFGLFCRADDDYKQSRYEFLLTSGGEARLRGVAKGTGGNLTPPAPVTGLEKGKPVRLQAECTKTADGVRLTMWVDGERVQSYLDTTVGTPTGLPNGDVGFLARVPEQSGARLKMGFDDFTLQGGAPGT
ncbi:serine/threonine-protein kinase [Sphaerisporangium fuscum]|uniref:serine/threonine-protein kinase n=1 Tax=Sphaerisporangium fuscum TaxID=2835868 RepID=UPI0027E21BE1|nr:serine/threonine-protein kinase [Sphaerisporangium fuscum]